jgi:hypothetical protein
MCGMPLSLEKSEGILAKINSLDKKNELFSLKLGLERQTGNGSVNAWFGKTNRKRKRERFVYF